MKYFFILTILLAMTTPRALLGQEESKQDLAGAPLSLPAAIEEALRKNADIRSEEARLEEAKGQEKAMSSIPNQPFLSVNVEASSHGLDRFETSFSHTFRTGGKRKIQQEMGQAQVQSQEASVTQKKAKIAAQTAHAYIDFWLMAEMASLARERAAVSQSARESAEKRRTAGDLSELDFLIAKAEEERIQATLFLVEGNLEVSRAQFASVLGRRPDAPIQILPPTPLVSSLSKEELLQAIAKAPQFLREESNVELAAKTLDYQQRFLAPDPVLRFGAGIERIVFDQNNFLGNPGTIEGLEDTDAVFFTAIQVPLPLFRKQNQGRIEAAKGVLLAKEALRDAQKRDLSASILGAYGRLQAALQAKTLLEQAIPRYEEAERLVQKGYLGGELPIDSLLLARQRVFLVKEEFLQVKAETFHARIDIFAYLGEIPK